MNKYKRQILGFCLSILFAFGFMIIAQWSVLGYSIFYNSLLYVVLFLLHGYIFGLIRGIAGVTVVLIVLVTMLVSDHYYQMTHFFQNGLMVTACITGGCFRLKKYYLSFVGLLVVFTLFGFAYRYHTTPRYLTNSEITIETINIASSKLIGHSRKQLKLNADTVYLVNFSFRNCTPCRRKKKSIEKIAHDFKNAPFKIIEIHAFEDEKIFETDYFFDYAETYHDSKNRLSKKLKVIGFPTEFLFDKKGNFVRRFDGFEQDTKTNYEKTTSSLLKRIIYEN